MRKKLKISKKIWVFYIIVFVFLIYIAVKLFGSPKGLKLISAVSKDPTNIEKVVNLADFYYENTKYAEASGYYKRAIALHINRLAPCDLYKKIILSQMKLKQTEVIDYIQKALKQCNDTEFLNYFNDALDYTLKKMDTQIIFFKETKPSLSKKIESLQLIYLKKGLVLTLYYKLDGNEKYLSRLKKINKNDYNILVKYPLDIQSRLLLGKYAKDAHLFKISKLLLNGVSEKLSGSLLGECYYNLGYISYNENQFSVALTYYKKARKFWNSTKVNYWLSKTYYQLGETKQAIKYINYTLKIDPKYVDAVKFKDKIKGE
ncbi:hypothetical protein J7L48_03470 [bacterium]|nr:hypothetical protein [bacterium]